MLARPLHADTMDLVPRFKAWRVGATLGRAVSDDFAERHVPVIADNRVANIV